ncbi:MAG: SH3 domain-containing protein, partial [Rhodobacterales bacterium]|nr:SH3 domain-containing protein [Rhodobacterales bacterium]
MLTLAALAAGTAPALAVEMQPPTPGSKYAFDCALATGQQYQETYTILEVNGDQVLVHVDTAGVRNRFEKPYYFLPTTLMKREQVSGVVGKMNSVPSEFNQLKNLEVGKKYSGWLDEFRGAKRLGWSYKIAVIGSELYYVPGSGDLNVVEVDEQRYTGSYSSELLTYYSPDMRYPVYWKYEDSNEREIECKLASAELKGAAAMAKLPPVPAAPAAPQPETLDLKPAPSEMWASTNANVRARPTTDSARIGGVEANDPVYPQGAVTLGGETWYQVALAGGATGYIHGGLLSEQKPAPPPAPETPMAAA